MFDLTGRVFNGVKVVKYSESTSYGHSMWLCRCPKCKELFHVSRSNLLSGNTKGCSNCRNRKLTNAEINKLVQLKNAGMTYTAIAKQYGLNRSTVTKYIKRVKANIMI
jgi:Zn-finger nucleic acid-binding protein